MKSKLRARTPIIALAFIGIAVLFIASCTTNEVDIPGLTGPSGARLFITIEASPDSVFIRKPSSAPGTSRITLQLKNQLGQGVPNARIKLIITNSEGAEVGIGSLDHLTVVTDSAGFARVTYTAPSTAEQPVPVIVFITAILVDPAYAFEVVSTHKLDLELTRPFECIAGPGSPAISFTATPSPGVVDIPVCFDAQGTTDNGAIISFSWDFGDNRTDTGLFTCHTFTRDGSFPVTLTVVDGDQNCVSLTQFIQIGVGGAPTCSFTTSPNPVNTDTTVFFDASASTDADGNIVSFAWNFGDGSTRGGERVTHSFDTEGSFTVTLIVTDNAGNETTCTQTVTVATGIPSCDFTIDPSPAVANEEVTFDGSASTDPDGGNLSFAWDLDNNGLFNDGSDEIVTFTYTTEGVKVVSLRVTDEEGNESTCTQSVTVGEQPLPTCTFDADPNPSCAGDNVTFDASASDPNDTLITDFRWDFDCTPPNLDSTDSTAGPIAIFAFPTAGNFNVCLEITNSDDLTATCNRPQVVTDQPSITSFDPPSASVGTSVTITGTNFRGTTAVLFDGVNAPGFSVNGTGTQITVQVPNNATDGPITVTNGCGSDVSDDDFDVLESLTIDDVGVPNPAVEGGAIQFTVRLSGPRTVATTFDFTTNDGTATGGVSCATNPDYQITAEVGRIIPAGATTTVITVPTCIDGVLAETQEDFTVTISNPSAGVAIGTPSSGTGSIAANGT